MVITRTTRNRFVLTGTRVRIPPSPFIKKQRLFVLDRCCFFALLRSN